MAVFGVLLGTLYKLSLSRPAPTPCNFVWNQQEETSILIEELRKIQDAVIQPLQWHHDAQRQSERDTLSNTHVASWPCLWGIHAITDHERGCGVSYLRDQHEAECIVYSFASQRNARDFRFESEVIDLLPHCNVHRFHAAGSGLDISHDIDALDSPEFPSSADSANNVIVHSWNGEALSVVMRRLGHSHLDILRVNLRRHELLQLFSADSQGQWPSIGQMILRMDRPASHSMVRFLERKSLRLYHDVNVKEETVLSLIQREWSPIRRVYAPSKSMNDAPLVFEDSSVFHQTRGITNPFQETDNAVSRWKERQRVLKRQRKAKELADQRERDRLMVDREAVIELLRERSLNNSVIVVSADFGFAHFLHNFICNMKALGNEHWIVGPLDEKIYEYALNQGWPTIPYPLVELRLSHGRMSAQSVGTISEVGSVRYKELSFIKMIPSLIVLGLKYDAILIDPDIYIHRDPMEYLLGLKQRGYDFIIPLEHQSCRNSEFCINSGLWFANHANPLVLSMLRWTFYGVPDHVFGRNIREDTDTSDQDFLKHFGCESALGKKTVSGVAHIREPCHGFESKHCRIAFDSRNMSWFYLNPDLFASGDSRLHSPGARPRDCNIKFSKQSQTNPAIERFTVHNNWCWRQAKKPGRFQKSGMWFLAEDDAGRRCKAVLVSSNPKTCTAKSEEPMSPPLHSNLDRPASARSFQLDATATVQLPPCAKRNTIEALFHMINTLYSKATIRVFPRSGFLLGVIRHGGFLPNEPHIDADLGVMYIDTTTIKNGMTVESDTGIVYTLTRISTHNDPLSNTPFDAESIRISSGDGSSFTAKCFFPYGLPQVFYPLYVDSDSREGKMKEALRWNANGANSVVLGKGNEHIPIDDDQVMEDNLGYLFQREWFDTLVPVKFYDLRILVPVGYQHILKNCYGSGWTKVEKRDQWQSKPLSKRESEAYLQNGPLPICEEMERGQDQAVGSREATM